MSPDEAQNPLYFSDRHDLRGPPVLEVGAEFWAGFTKIWGYLNSEGYLVAEWGSGCGVRLRSIGVDSEVRLRLATEIGLEWDSPSPYPPVPASNVAIDTVEFFARVVQKPLAYHWHEVRGLFNSHRDFWNPDREAGLAEYSRLVNGLFRVHGHPFQLDGVKVVRRGEQEYEAILRRSAASTGDAELDELLESARVSFYSINPASRKLAVEKSWDAFERMKTVLDPGSKAHGAALLVDRASRDSGFRSMLEREAREITQIGNDFRIRHHEVGKFQLSEDQDVDYFFYRLWTLIQRLLPGLVVERTGTAERGGIPEGTPPRAPGNASNLAGESRKS